MSSASSHAWSMPRGAEREQALIGGTANRGLVVRVGDTVRRPLRAEAPSTHALLRHLEKVGFDGAPRVLGIDEQQREVLTFIEGETVLPPYPAWALTDRALQSVAHLLRDFHDASADFAAGQRRWSVAVTPGYHDGGVVCHNDPNLDNVVFRDGRAVALIDFDLAAPGARLWDVAAAVRLWAPLRDAGDIADTRRGKSFTRLGRFVDAYGLSSADREALSDAVLASHDWCYDVVETGAETGHVHFARYWHRGGAARARRTRAWTLCHAAAVRSAVTGS